MQSGSPLTALPVIKYLVTAQDNALAVNSSKRPKHYALLALGLVALLSSCAPALSQQDIENANYGAPITQARARQLAESYLSQVLLDPYSAHVQFGQVYRGYFNEALIYGGGPALATSCRPPLTRETASVDTLGTEDTPSTSSTATWNSSMPMK